MDRRTKVVSGSYYSLRRIPADLTAHLDQGAPRSEVLGALGILSTTRQLPGLSGHVWPNPDDELLLLASLGPDEVAADAWRRLRPRFALDEITYQQYELLPLLGDRLRKLGLDDPVLPALTDVIRYTWRENRLRQADLSRVISAFDAVGIPVLVLKGVGLVATCYAHAGLRRMTDADVMVPELQRDAALAVLAADGWDVPSPQKLRRFPLQYAWGVKHSNGARLDLHWKAPDELVVRGDEARSCDDLWEASVEIDIAGVPARTLCPPDHLLHVTLHGLHWISHAQLRWVADAMTILASNAFDWDRLIHQARRRRLTWAMRNALSYLRFRVHGRVPQHAIDLLAATRPDYRERLAFTARSTPLRRSRWVGNVVPLLAKYVDRSTHLPLGRAVLGIPAFLRDRWGVDESQRLVTYVASRAAQRLRRREDASTP
ncbi:MAG: nucleotidyltransferase family protein [Acidimicrobiia bacterium]